jgi:hypothetical protein
MKNCEPLSKITHELIPEYYNMVDWSNIWSRKLENGTAFEWTVWASIIHCAKAKGIRVSIPLIEDFNAGDFFILRNEIPHPHGAQAGNSATALSSKALKYRFLYSLVPKAIFEIDNRYYSVFREGCPYHKIMYGDNYLDRTDIVVIPGKPTKGFPRFNSSENEVSYSYELENTTLTGILRVLNSSLIPCKRRNPNNNIHIPATGIIECSVNKSYDVATNQLKKYEQLFSTETSQPALSLVTGNDLSSVEFDNHHIHLDSEDISLIKSELLSASESILRNFSIID